MPSWFLRGIGHRVATTRYPRGRGRLDPWTEDLPAPPAFDPLRVTPSLAEAVVGVCPSRALEFVDGDLVLDLWRCTACGRCRDVAGAASRSSHCIELSGRGDGDRWVRIKTGRPPT